MYPVRTEKVVDRFLGADPRDGDFARNAASEAPRYLPDGAVFGLATVGVVELW